MTVKNIRDGLSELLFDVLEHMDAAGTAGLVQVPSEPGPEMLAAGARAGRIDPDTARRIYRAMVQAEALDDGAASARELFAPN